MAVLVSDTSVIIDLERGAFLNAAFSLSYRLAVPDLLYERELRGEWGDELIKLGLSVEELDGEGVALALRFRESTPSLSLPDSFALVLAKQRQWTLLTGDKVLRQLAIQEHTACYGVLWLIDQLNDQSIVTPAALLEGLQAIARHPRCRLPLAEIRVRLIRFEALISKGHPEDPGKRGT